MSAGLDLGTDRDALPLTRTVPLRKPSPLDCASSREPWMGSWGKIIPSANGGEEGGGLVAPVEAERVWEVKTGLGIQRTC